MSRPRHKTRHPGIYYREDAQGARRYIVWYEDSLGKGRTVTLPLGANLEDAKAKRAGLTRTKLVPTRMTMGTLLDEWLERRRPGLKASTLHVYTWGVARAKDDVGQVKLQKFTADSIVALRQRWLLEGLRKQSISNIEGPLRMALKAAARDGLIQVSPFDKLLHHERVPEDQKEMLCLSSDEINRLLKPGKNSGEQWTTLWAFLLFTGLRISEALTLGWDDVDLSGGSLLVTEGKTKAARREVMLIPALCGLLRAWKLKQDPGAELVFPFPYRTVHSALRRAEDAAGLPHYRIHELRHTFASILIAQGENVVFVSKQLGHRDPSITLAVYAHLFDAQDRVDQARERLQAAYGGLV